MDAFVSFLLEQQEDGDSRCPGHRWDAEHEQEFRHKQARRALSALTQKAASLIETGHVRPEKNGMFLHPHAHLRLLSRQDPGLAELYLEWQRREGELEAAVQERVGFAKFAIRDYFGITPP